MQCPSCTNEIPDHARFCAFCGTPIRRCPACHHAFPNEAEFCGACGTTLSIEIDRSKFRTANIAMDEASQLLLDEDERWLNRDQQGTYGFVYDPKYPERRFYLQEGDVTVGAGDKNDIVIDRPAVSWNHALILCRNSKVTVQDSASTNGTYVNEVRVSRPRELRHGDLLRLGNVEYRLWLKPQIRNQR